MPEWLSPTLIWFLIGLAFVLSEFFIPGLVVVFFGIGAWVTAVTCAIGLTKGLAPQLGVFLVASLGTLALLRAWLKGAFRGHVPKKQNLSEPMEDIVGADAVVVKDIVPGKLDGQVRFRGSVWKAKADAAIANDEVVKIVKRDNLVLHVEKMSREQDNLEAMDYPPMIRSELFFLVARLYEIWGQGKRSKELLTMSVATDKTLRWPAWLARQKLAYQS